MVPQLDAALALPVVGASALLASVVVTGRGLIPRSLLAGALAAAALFTSYGAAVFLAIGALAQGALAPSPRELGRRWLPAVAMTTTTALLLTASSGFFGHHPITSARTALAIHREAYTTPRSYVLWLLFNPTDFALFLGPPIAAQGLARLWRVARTWPPALTPSRRFGLVLAGALVVLVASGLTRGEVGRIWIPLMPFFFVAVFAPAEHGEASESRGGAVLIGSLLLAVCLVVRNSWDL
jgi:hypothetical protein